jgi:hypothetical protein
LEVAGINEKMLTLVSGSDPVNGISFPAESLNKPPYVGEVIRSFISISENSWKVPPLPGVEVVLGAGVFGVCPAGLVRFLPLFRVGIGEVKVEWRTGVGGPEVDVWFDIRGAMVGISSAASSAVRVRMAT